MSGTDIKSRAFGAAVCVAALVAPGVALACDAEMWGSQTEIETKNASAQKTLKVATRKLEAQERRLQALSPADQAKAPSAPVAPTADIDGVDDRGRITLNCVDFEAERARLAAIAAATAGFEQQVTAFSDAVAAREAALLKIENQAGADVAPAPTPAPSPAPNRPTGEPETSPVEPAPQPVDPGPQAAAPQPAPTPAPAPAAPETAPPAAAGGSGAFQPLLVKDQDLLYQRVLSLPDAKLHSEPGVVDAAAPKVQPFSVLYVFERSQVGGAEWVRVGPQFSAAPLGWLPTESTEQWNSMLVMQFAPRGRRERVIFFDRVRPLQDLVTSPLFEQEATEIYNELKSGSVSNQAIIAAEPASAVVYGDEPYLFPILAHQQEIFDDSTNVNLVRVASVSVSSRERTKRDDDSIAQTKPKGDLSGFKIGVVFVMDTTTSMRPHLERTKETVKEFYDSFGAALGDKVSYGLIGYRDNFEHDPSLEYVTRVFQPLELGADPNSVVRNVNFVDAARTATIDWREDAFAGLNTALDEMPWEDFDARLIILVTDAGARFGNDPKALLEGMTEKQIATRAAQKKVAIAAVHLITPEAVKKREVDFARRQYSTLGADTGDTNAVNYISLPADSGDFRREIRKTADQIAASLQASAKNQTTQVNDGEVEAPKTNDGDVTSPYLSGGSLADIIANEILRAQLEYIGGQDDAEAPNFLSGWAADRDLVNPAFAAMEVGVFLNRNQLSALADSVNRITDAFKAAEKSPGSFFDELQLIAAQNSRDPEAVRADEQRAVEELLPAFVRGLPYRSEVLKLNREYWNGISNADRQAFIDDLEGKLRTYQSLFDQTENWVDFGAGDPALRAYPIKLSLLP